MKRTVATVIIFILFALSLPLSLMTVGFGFGAKFDETYYGELKFMVERLYAAQGKKIVFIGNSGAAFGIRTDLIEKEFDGFKAVNFGLYGAIGTKAMLDMAQNAIQEGDIVIVLPEQTRQSLSLYFSAANLWPAADGNFRILREIKKENRSSMAGNFPAFAAQKFSYILSGKRPLSQGVYSQSAFDDADGNETGYMTFERPYNIMAGGYDPNNPASFKTDVIQEDFIVYLNAFYDSLVQKGAALYFGFAPLNRLATDLNCDEKQIETYVGHLREKLKCPILGSPFRFILDFEWFYDNNVHMNSAGAVFYTCLLTETLKAALADSSPTEIVVPEKPQTPAEEAPEGDNSDLDCFVCEVREEGAVITGLTDKGSKKASLKIPTAFNGKPVVSFAADVFSGNTLINEILIPKSVRLLYDNSFQGCTKLMKLVLKEKNPSRLAVGTRLLGGAPDCRIYVPDESFDLYKTHYNWSAYRQILLKY